MGISGANRYVLVFRVEYQLETGEVLEETIVSNSFQVVANANSFHKMKPNQGNIMLVVFGFIIVCFILPLTSPTEHHDAPTVQGLQPKEGHSNSETEVWIKGLHFSSQGSYLL